tara:strand:- start:3773 stop:4192 length:420 start_codon:yes stop_codon:yes gene_type:complete
MALMKLVRHRPEGEMVIGKGEYSIGAHTWCEVPANIAIDYCCDESILIDFTQDDKKHISTLDDRRLRYLKAHLNVAEEDDVLSILYPKKKSAAKKKVEEVMETVVETIAPAKEEVKETPAKKTTTKKTPAKKTTKKDVK